MPSRAARRATASSSTPEITALRELRGGRVEVELGGAAWRVFPVDVVVRAGLTVGAPFDRARARALAHELRRDDALHRAARALRTRDLSRRELDARLERQGVGAAARAETVGALERGGVVDDDRFALGRAESLAGRGYGNEAIRHDLEQRGVEPEALEAALAALEPERVRVERLLVRHGPGPATARRLAARGFGEDAVETAGGGSVAGEG